MEHKQLEEKTDQNISKILNPNNKYKRIEAEVIAELTSRNGYTGEPREKQEEKYSKIMKRTSEYMLEFGC